MYNSITEVKKAYENKEISSKQYWAFTQYFDAVKVPSEDVLVMHEYFWDEDDYTNLVDMSTNSTITKKELFLKFSKKDLKGWTLLTHNDLIDCNGHILSKENIMEIFWNWGN